MQALSLSLSVLSSSSHSHLSRSALLGKEGCSCSGSNWAGWWVQQRARSASTKPWRIAVGIEHTTERGRGITGIQGAAAAAGGDTAVKDAVAPLPVICLSGTLRRIGIAPAADGTGLAFAAAFVALEEVAAEAAGRAAAAAEEEEEGLGFLLSFSPLRSMTPSSAEEGRLRFSAAATAAEGMAAAAAATAAGRRCGDTAIEPKPAECAGRPADEDEEEEEAGGGGRARADAAAAEEEEEEDKDEAPVTVPLRALPTAACACLMAAATCAALRAAACDSVACRLLATHLDWLAMPAAATRASRARTVVAAATEEEEAEAKDERVAARGGGACAIIDWRRFQSLFLAGNAAASALTLAFAKLVGSGASFGSSSGFGFMLSLFSSSERWSPLASVSSTQIGRVWRAMILFAALATSATRAASAAAAARFACKAATSRTFAAVF